MKASNKASGEILAWHFCADTLRDGLPIPKDGEWLKFDDKPILCEQGLHASLNPFDALQYAPGATLCRVALRGEVVEGNDKLCATERMIICRMDATELLRYFARMQAVKALEYWQGPPPDVVLDYLMTGEKAIRDAALDAVRGAARGAVRGAARGAAWGVAWGAAWGAASAAANAAARDAAWGAAKDEFVSLVHECFGI